MEEIKKQLEALSAALADLQAKVAGMEKPAEAVEAMSAKTTELETKVTALSADFQAELSKRDRTSLLKEAAFAGKVVQLTDEAIAKLSVTDLQAHINALPVTVPLARRTFGAPPPSGDGTSVIEQFNAIADPAKRAEFYKQHRKEIVGK